MVDTTTLGTDLPAENIPYNVSHIFISRGEESMNKTISTDQDFNLWVLLHQTRDALCPIIPRTATGGAPVSKLPLRGL